MGGDGEAGEEVDGGRGEDPTDFLSAFGHVPAVVVEPS